MKKPLPNFLATTGVVSARQKESNEKPQSHVASSMSHWHPSVCEYVRLPLSLWRLKIDHGLGGNLKQAAHQEANPQSNTL